MKSPIYLSLLIVLWGCDVPQRTRLTQSPQILGGANNLENSGSNSGTGSFTNGGITYQPNNNQDPSTTTNNPSQNTDTRFANCDLSAKYSTYDIGSFGICQSSYDETLFKVKFTSSTSGRNCLIPAHTLQDGSSVYLGQPQCTLVQQNNAEIIGSLPKTRRNAQSYLLNSVIVMKENILKKYFDCMDSYSNWLQWLCPSGAYTSRYCAQWVPNCPRGAESSYYCQVEASAFKRKICEEFKANYRGYYLEIRTK